MSKKPFILAIVLLLASPHWAAAHKAPQQTPPPKNQKQTDLHVWFGAHWETPFPITVSVGNKHYHYTRYRQHAFPKKVWIPGHWEWLGKRKGYAWIPRHWEKRPHNLSKKLRHRKNKWIARERTF